MVYPVHDLDFKISTTGKIAEKDAQAITSMTSIAELETFEPAFDGVVEEWSPMEAKGWLRRMMTGKSFSVSITGKRSPGDDGNDYVAACALKIGQEATSTGAIVFPDGEALIFDCVIDVSKNFGGDSTNISGLEFELLSDDKPVYVTSVPAG